MINAFYSAVTFFSKCDVIKNWARHLHKVRSSKFGATLFAKVSQRRVTRCQFHTFVEFTSLL